VIGIGAIEIAKRQRKITRKKIIKSPLKSSRNRKSLKSPNVRQKIKNRTKVNEQIKKQGNLDVNDAEQITVIDTKKLKKK
jgi:hypothetical protein